MSRIGKLPIKLEDGVSCKVSDGVVSLKGPKGELSYKLPDGIGIKVENNTIYLTRVDDTKKVKALHGLARSILKNNLIGVTKGYEKNLEINGIGYRAQLSGSALHLSVGHSHPVVINPPEGIKFTLEGQTKIKVSGIDKQLVGQVAKNIRQVRVPDPYHAKGIKFVEERIKLKAGKTGAK
ncbi:MAG TPA: 50S ribosomal protein L6 [bacterium]|nr:50S ribosomal protein L6 [bacterium]HPQ20088.1 50S ribosomal protein L6 [bacterium]